jgi:hypothetical protein
MKFECHPNQQCGPCVSVWVRQDTAQASWQLKLCEESSRLVTRKNLFGRLTTPRQHTAGPYNTSQGSQGSTSSK